MSELAAIAERDARGATAALYADIRATLGVPVVNLVWRHLATIDDALAWVWGAIKPLYGEPRLDVEAAGLCSIARCVELPRISVATLSAAGIDAAEAQVLRRVLANYDHSNPRNLLTLMALAARLDAAADEPRPLPARAASAAPVGATVNLGTLPPLLTDQEMTGATRDSALRFEGLGCATPARAIVGGVPRHLAHWPEFLSLSVRTLEPFEYEIGSGIARVHESARARAHALETLLAPCALPPRRTALEDALKRFSSRELIANYIVKVQLLIAALPPGD